jgi:hypothetical protein
VHPNSNTLFHSPISNWDVHFDSVLTSENFIRQFGWPDANEDSVHNPPIYTNGWRLWGWSLRFIIDRGTRPQYITVDSCFDSINGSLKLGINDSTHLFTPFFQHGRIRIGFPPPPVGIDETETDLPDRISLTQNYPNPFNPSTEIGFSLPQRSEVRLVIYNLLGQEVRALLDQTFEPGRHSIMWDGRDNSGGNVPSGAYFYRLTALGFSDSKIMTLIR